MKKFFAATFVLVLACSATSSADTGAPVPSAAGNTDADTKLKMESSQPMNRDEPMPTGMAKEGMKKGDVRAHALKKDAAMDEMMKQEEMKK